VRELCPVSSTPPNGPLVPGMPLPADNFGFMTVFFDTLFKTVKHPKADAFALSRGLKPMPESEKVRSADLSVAILERRGREALSKDDAKQA